MAELKGPIQFTGSLGNLRAYYSPTLKRYIVATKGGQTRDMIKRNPTFVRQRENMQEFKACSFWSSQLRKSLLSIDHLHKGYYFSEIIALAKTIQKHDDVHLKGTRYIESSKDAQLLTFLNFNRIHPFDQVFSHQFEILFSDDKKTITLKLMGFKSVSRINWPVRFESYRIALVIARIPDYIWNERDKCFQPVLPNLERQSIATFSDWHPRSTETEDIILSASFVQPAFPQPGITVIVAMGIEVSMDPGVMNSDTQSGFGTMKIVECFV